MNRLDRRLAVVALGLGVFLLLAGVALFLASGQMTRPAQVMLFTGVALLIVYAILDPTAALDLIRSRQSRFGSLSVAVSALVIGILVVLNVLVSKGAQTWDLTNAKLFTLSPQSVLVAQMLNRDVTVTGFFGSRDDHSKLSQLLSLYQAQSPHIKVTFEDPNLHLADVRQYGVTVNQTLVVAYPGKQPILLTVGSQTEQDITTAILKLERGRSPNVCWAVGDGEKDLADSTQVGGYSSAATQLVNNDFRSTNLLLSQQTAIPATCDVLAVIGPQNPISDGGVAAIKAYLAGGGKLLIASDPWRPAVVKTLNAALADYGVTFSGGVVLDDANDSAQGRPAVPAVFGRYSTTSPITKDIGNQASFFPDTSSIGGNPPSAVTTDRLAYSSGQAYEILQQRTDPTRQAADPGGPFTLMASIEQPKQGTKQVTRIVMAGTSSFAANEVMSSSPANQHLFTASMSWLAQQESLISIPPKPQTPLSLSLTGAQVGFDTFVSMALLPLLVLAGGVMVWWRRRRLVA